MDQPTVFVYTLSAVFQGVAALMAIAAVFVVFRLQELQRRSETLLGEMVLVLDEANLFFQHTGRRQSSLPETYRYLIMLERARRLSVGDNPQIEAEQIHLVCGRDREMTLSLGLGWVNRERDPFSWLLTRLFELSEAIRNEKPKRPETTREDFLREHKVDIDNLQRLGAKINAIMEPATLLAERIRRTKDRAKMPAYWGGSTITVAGIALLLLPTLYSNSVVVTWAIVCLCLLGAIVTIGLTIRGVHDVLFSTGSKRREPPSALGCQQNSRLFRN